MLGLSPIAATPLVALWITGAVVIIPGPPQDTPPGTGDIRDIYSRPQGSKIQFWRQVTASRIRKGY